MPSKPTGCLSTTSPGGRDHVAQTYGGMRPVSRPARGGLAPWQERRAKEILSANLDGSVPLKEVARECRLSVSHFSRAFRRTMGVAPHNWLLTRRIEVAKEKLRDTGLSLSDVALACGFADQSHLTRVFTGWSASVRAPGVGRWMNSERSNCAVGAAGRSIMATSDGYGQRLGERLRVEKAPAIVTKTLRKAEIAFTEIRCDDPLPK